MYGVETAVFLILVGIYKAPTYDKSLFLTKAGGVLIAGAISLIISMWSLLRQVVLSGPSRGRAVPTIGSGGSDHAIG